VELVTKDDAAGPMTFPSKFILEQGFDFKTIL